MLATEIISTQKYWYNQEKKSENFSKIFQNFDDVLN